MKSPYRVALYFNPWLNDEGASMVDRAPMRYIGGSKLNCNVRDCEVVLCPFDAAEFIFDCKNTQLPLIEYKKSSIPPTTELNNSKEIRRWKFK